MVKKVHVCPLPKGQCFGLWSQCAPNSTETQKELKWPKSDSKVTRADRPESDLNWLKSDSGPHLWVTFESLLSHLKSLWSGTPGVTFESLLGHFISLCVSVELGARPLHKIWGDSIKSERPRCPQNCNQSQKTPKGQCKTYVPPPKGADWTSHQIGSFQTHTHTSESVSEVILQWTAKGPAEGGHVKKSQKVSKMLSTLFDIFRAGQKTSKIVKKCQKYFWHFLWQFSRGTSFPAPFGGSEFCWTCTYTFAYLCEIKV